MQTLLGFFGVVGTLILAAVAIWGDWFRANLAPLKLELELRNPRGSVIPTANGEVVWYHLHVVNRRRWISARNCRVLLRGISKRGPDGQFHPETEDVARQFIWAPSEFTPPFVTIQNDQHLDFGFVRQNGDRFCLTLYSMRNDQPGNVLSDEAYRYSLEIQGDGFVSKTYTVIEVAWDGGWSNNLDQMEQHLRMRIIEE